MIPFIQATAIDMVKYSQRLNRCKGVYSNHGRHELALVEYLEDVVERPVATACNATIALQILQGNLPWVRPAFTFPATNCVPDELPNYVQPIMSGSLLGFSPPANVPQVLTVPFGCHTPGLAHTCTVPTLVDAAACASPTMHIVREWLENGAKAVVVSLHATKIWNAGEGAFVAFGHSSDRDRFLHMQNFGIYIDADGNRQCSDPYATNGKMSEFSAIAALASRNNFHAEYDRREEIVRRLQDICVSKEIDYIPSHQSFWIAPNQTWQKTVALFDAFDVETRNYYWDTEITPHSNLCQRGVCLPTHDERIIDIFDKKVSELICD